MAKKKETVLTPEERLQTALVPDWEQPYKVPENWCWVTLESINQYQSSSIDPSRQPESYFELYSVPSSANNYPEIALGCEIGSMKQSVEKDDVLLCKINPRINRVWKVSQYTENTLAASSEWIIIRNPYIHSDYLMYCLRAPYFREYMLSNVSGVGGSLMRAQPKYVQAYPIPVSPLSEQQRIVDRIESLFAKLDEAKQRAQAALDSVETRKAAILQKAFTGELTAQWRKENGVEMEGWRKTALQEVCEKIVCGKTPTGFICPTGKIPYLKVYNIVNNKISFESAPQFIPKEIHEGRLKSSILKPNDIVMNIVGPPLRKIAIIPADYPEWNMNQAIVRFRPLAPLKHRFLYYALINPETLDNVISETRGVVGQANISVAQSRNLIIPLPSINEQIEIVRILDDLLAKEQQAREAAEAVIEQIDIIKKSILARAFRGELGTNDPAEESSVELVRKILEKDDEMETSFK